MDDRRRRGLTQRIYLVKLDTFNTKLVFHVLGASRHVYQISCAKNRVPKCSCPDSTVKRNTCKHIFFVCEKVMGIPPYEWMHVQNITEMTNQVLWSLPHLGVMVDESRSRRYDEILQKRTGKENSSKSNESSNSAQLVIRNEECCVCLSPIEATSKEITVCETCMNGIHDICWEKWSQVNQNGNCVYCRTIIKNADSMIGSQTARDFIEESGWGIRLE
jgi:hypothetical protein